MEWIIKALAEQFGDEDDAFLIFARNDEGRVQVIDDRLNNLAGLVFLIELFSKNIGKSFSDTLEAIRKLRLDEDVDYYITKFVLGEEEQNAER